MTTSALFVSSHLKALGSSSTDRGGAQAPEVAAAVARSGPICRHEEGVEKVGGWAKRRPDLAALLIPTFGGLQPSRSALD